jgi:hypothetical protein
MKTSSARGRAQVREVVIESAERMLRTRAGKLIIIMHKELQDGEG